MKVLWTLKMKRKLKRKKKRRSMMMKNQRVNLNTINNKKVNLMPSLKRAMNTTRKTWTKMM